MIPCIAVDVISSVGLAQCVWEDPVNVNLVL